MGKMLTDYSNLHENKEMKEYAASMKHLYWVLGVAVVFYYVIPYIFMLAFGQLPASLYGFLVVDVFSFFVFIACFLFSRKHGVIWYVPIMTALLYLPTVIIFNCAWQYAVFTIVYVVLGYFGCLAGYLFLRRKKNRKAPIGVNYAVRRSNRDREKNGK